ncbi:DUF1801 domain-containing protein [Hylemonella gracilis]|uniref:DUF1801 domain-containing protein n=1 Tax=Hylemonella gracilis TaxID=80880 RepID=A0A4P6UNM4_9BURK|nr:DUF1801 domain-containing protein [Hylemonella gracilis]QBK05201.1 DUF1801 domain-containing protein [Hylemonella gracilis]
MKMNLASARTPDEYMACLTDWQRAYVGALRLMALTTVPQVEERLRWGHLVYFMHGPVLLIRVESQRILFGFWRGLRLRHIEPRLKPGGKYEMATLELLRETPLEKATVQRLVQRACVLNRGLGDPTAAAAASAGKEQT